MIRRATEQDLAKVLQIERKAATAPHWPPREYEEIVRGDGLTRCLYVAEENGIVGFAVGKVVGNEGEVESIAVETEAQQHGVGASLLRAVIDWCKREGAGVVDLEVRAGSERALRLYERAGFVEIGRRPRYYSGPVEDAVLMRVTVQ